jgi:hypothetical protein
MKLPLRFFDVKHIGDMMQQISVQGVVLGQYHQIAPIFSVKQPVCLYLFFRLKRLWKAILPWG